MWFAEVCWRTDSHARTLDSATTIENECECGQVGLLRESAHELQHVERQTLFPTTTTAIITARQPNSRFRPGKRSPRFADVLGAPLRRA